MEKKQKVTEEEKAKLCVVSALAAMPIKAAGYPALIAIGIPQGMQIAMVGEPEELAFGKANFGFKVLCGLACSIDALTPEEQEQITKISKDAMERQNAHNAAAAGAAAVETSDSAAVEETATGGEAQHG